LPFLPNRSDDLLAHEAPALVKELALLFTCESIPTNPPLTPAGICHLPFGNFSAGSPSEEGPTQKSSLETDSTFIHQVCFTGSIKRLLGKSNSGL